MTRQDKLRRLWETMPFNAACGLLVQEWSPDAVTLTCAHRPELTNGAGTLHGGVVSTLIDSAATAAVIAGTGEDDRRVPVTASLSVHFTGPGSADLTARARVTRRGHATCFVSVEVVDKASKPVAEALACIQLR
ncbi:PaaI family thioesterase [Nonomuraea wenchangensis]|uniref:PaaI family thioesterase n=1 Tax=Nonomuraea wenchangensis TaxID=568860 RepID=UPI003449BBD8